MPPPQVQYTSIADARSKVDQFVSLVGISVGFKPPKMSFGIDWQATVELCDKSAAVYENNLTVRIFRPDSESLPQDMTVGETIVVFKDIKIGLLKKQGNAVVAMTNKNRSSWVICKASLPPSRRKSIGIQRPTIRIIDNGPFRVSDPEAKKDLLSEGEYEACKDLFEFFHNRGGLSGCFGVNERAYNETIKPRTELPKRAALIKEIQLDHFYDLTCLVQKVWTYSRFVDITVTDFTENQELYPASMDPFNDGQENILNETHSYMLEGGGVTKKHGSFADKKWYEKPFGRYSLKVAFWDSLAQKASEQIKEGCYVALMNVRIKRGKGGNWEGSLSDPKNVGHFKDGFRVLKPDDPALRPLLNRKRELLKLVAQVHKNKSENDRKEKEEKEKAKLAEELKKRMENNPQVHCGYISIETTTISKIVKMLDGSDEDFYNRRYRTECRVVDFRPSDIRDFARRTGNDSGACVVDINASMGTGTSLPEWYWCFELDVIGKEGDSCLTIHVDDAAGRYLLTPEPCDLRADENRRKFEQLRNELFYLWGNLEEIKTKRRERIDLLQMHATTLVKQYNEGFDHRFLEKQYAKLEAERRKVQSLPIMLDPEISNKYFFAILKEYGEFDEDDAEGPPERKFILENTSVSRGVVAREREKAKEREDREKSARVQEESVRVPEGVEVMVIDE